MVRLHPRDIPLALKLVVWEGENHSQADLAAALHESPAEISGGLRRLEACALYQRAEHRVLRTNLFRFLKHGIRHVFPATLGDPAIGMMTARSIGCLVGKLPGGGHPLHVWPCNAKVAGLVNGHSIVPLYPGVPYAALDDRKLYDLLALTDLIRVSKESEHRRVASTALQGRICPARALPHPSLQTGPRARPLRLRRRSWRRSAPKRSVARPISRRRATAQDQRAAGERRRIDPTIHAGRDGCPTPEGGREKRLREASKFTFHES